MTAIVTYIAFPILLVYWSEPLLLFLGYGYVCIRSCAFLSTCSSTDLNCFWVQLF